MMKTSLPQDSSNGIALRPPVQTIVMLLSVPVTCLWIPL
jgi:hypothetical protein